MQFERMRPAELEQAVKDRPLAWMPIGTLEWHGRHLPVGLDALKAHALCLRIAEKSGGVVLPPNYFSILGMLFPWTFRYGPEVLAGSVMTTLERLYRYGFRVMFLITGHYPAEQVVFLMGLAQAFMAVHDAVVLAAPEFAMALDHGYYGDHAAKWETSIMMELFPELVDEKELEEIKGLRGLKLMRKGIYGENPGDYASRETGAEVVRIMVDNFAALSEELLETRDKGKVRRLHREFVAGHLESTVRGLLK